MQLRFCWYNEIDIIIRMKFKIAFFRYILDDRTKKKINLNCIFHMLVNKDSVCNNSGTFKDIGISTRIRPYYVTPLTIETIIIIIIIMNKPNVTPTAEYLQTSPNLCLSSLSVPLGSSSFIFSCHLSI